MRKQAGSIGQIERTPRAARPGDRPELRTGGAGSTDGERLWGVADVSTYIQIPISSIYKMTARKTTVRIPHIRIGGKLRFRRSDIDRWLTLLTVSNMEALSRMRQKALQVNHGDHSQAQAP